MDIVDCCGHWQNEHYRLLTSVARTENVQISDAIRGEKFYYLEKIRFPDFFRGMMFFVVVENCTSNKEIFIFTHKWREITNIRLGWWKLVVIVRYQ